jgi:hypothetical protein
LGQRPSIQELTVTYACGDSYSSHKSIDKSYPILGEHLLRD